MMMMMYKSCLPAVQHFCKFVYLTEIHNNNNNRNVCPYKIIFLSLNFSIRFCILHYQYFHLYKQSSL